MKIVKRDGQEVSFNGEKIALAIRKGFNGAITHTNYEESDHNKVYTEVINRLEEKYTDDDSVSIEEIQNTIEDCLKDLGYVEVYEAFSSYRLRRSESRRAFAQREHKLMKAIEALALKNAKDEDAKRENANIDGDTSMGTMLQFGSTVSKEFAKSYKMETRFAEAHDDGVIHIHDMDFLPMGTTTCCQIDLKELFKDGFSTGHGFLRTPNSILSYSSLAAIAIQSNQNDQHGGQSIPAFDYFMTDGVKKSFKKMFKQALSEYLELEGLLPKYDFDSLAKEIDELETIDFKVSKFKSYYKSSKRQERLFKQAYDVAIKKTDRQTYQAMEAFIHNLNTMHSRAGAQVPFSSVNLGTDTSFEGRMVIRNYLFALDAGLGHGETPIFPVSIFKVKEGINYNKKDPNYDLFKLACQVSAKRLFPNFSFLDASFNKPFYKKGDYNSEVAYMGCRTRVMANVANPDKAVTCGRGNLSFTTINLVRLGLKHGIILGERKEADMEGFYKELDDVMDLVKDQLYERFIFQCTKKKYNFPFLFGQGVWNGAKSLSNTDDVTPILRNGTLTTGFIGLAECLKALTLKHHGEDKKSLQLGYEIVKHMRERCDMYANEYKLNFTLIATPAEGLAGRFTGIDRSIYGKIEGVTDRDYYTNSFHVPVYYDISIIDKIKIEGPFHDFTNGGHISYIELDGDTANNLEAFEAIIRKMHDANMGYAAINHPVDRDPVCGYTGVIGDVCPYCGRKDGEGIPIERISEKRNENASIETCDC